MSDDTEERTFEGALVIGTHFSICDLPGEPFDWDAEAASDFLADVGNDLRNAMIMAGNEFLQNAVSNRFDYDGEGDTFDANEHRARGLKIARLSDGAWLKKMPAWLVKPGEPAETWVTGPEEATVFGAQEAATMSIPAGCVLVQDGTDPFATAEPEGPAGP